jgi:hypothetical protein
VKIAGPPAQLDLAPPGRSADNAGAVADACGASRRIGQVSASRSIVLPAAQQKFWELLSASAWTWIGLIFALVLLAWLIVRLRTWFLGHADPAEDARRRLSEIREMYHEGDLSREEYRSIKGRLMQQLDHTADADD